MKKMLLFLASSEALCLILALLACLFAAEALGFNKKCTQEQLLSVSRQQTCK